MVESANSSMPAPPRETLPRLFIRFLRFGLLAWGGPVAQIGLLREELVERERWISRERFNRVLAVYQALPGPEATELCCYFGMVSRGRVGSVVAGLGFVLPGFVMMFALSWLYVRYGVRAGPLGAAFVGMQAAVCALIVRAVHRIGGHALTDRTLWTIALGAAAGQLAGVHFAITLACAGAAAVLARKKQWALVAIIAAAFAGAVVWAVMHEADATAAMSDGSGAASPASAFGSGLRGGLLTFGGAYTVIPFLQRDAVEVGGWLTNEEFLDCLALSGVLPAPLIIFGTMVGYLAAGPVGSLLMTLGLFLPAFSFTLIGHGFFERLVDDARFHALLDGVTAGVVGLIGATAAILLVDAIRDLPAALIFAGALLTLYRWRSKWAIPAVVLGAAVVGFLALGS